MKCPECRNDIPDGSLKCMYCGYAIGESSGFRPRVVGDNGVNYNYAGKRMQQSYNENNYSAGYNYATGEMSTDIYGYPTYYRRQNVPVARSAKETNDRTVIYLLAALLATNVLNVLLIAAILILL